MQAVGAGLAGDGDGVEEGALEEQVAGVGGDAAVLATHHAGDGQGALVVGDHQGVGAQGHFLAVQQHQLLASLGHAHADAALDLGKIEGMHRLAQLEHHVVGHVDCRVDGAHVGTAQTLDHPQRSRARQVDVADHPAEVARAGLAGQHFDVAHFVMHRRYRGNDRAGHRSIVQGTNFTGQTDNRQAVAAVGGQVDLDAGIVEVEVAANVLAHRRIGGQLEQAVVLFADLQFGGRAEHAERLDAAQLGLLDLEVLAQHRADHGEGDLDPRAGIRRTADHLEGFAAIAHLADAQLVGVRVLFGCKDLADHHAAEDPGGGGDAVHLEAGHGQAGHQFIARNLRVNPGTQPLFAEFHPVLLKAG
ncbi:hypothetical protein D3C78_692690 [compost metagenome]